MYLDGIPEGEAGNSVAATQPVGDGEAVETKVVPEGGGRRLTEDPPHLPGRPEGPLQHLPLRGDGAPQPADARRPSEVGGRQELEDSPEEVPGGEGREVGVHGGKHLRRGGEEGIRTRASVGVGVRGEELLDEVVVLVSSAASHGTALSVRGR